MKPRARSRLQQVLDDADATVLDLVDHVLTKGVLLHGEFVLGLADVDLVYLRLSALLCAADRVAPAPASGARRRVQPARPGRAGRRVAS